VTEYAGIVYVSFAATFHQGLVQPFVVYYNTFLKQRQCISVDFYKNYFGRGLFPYNLNIAGQTGKELIGKEWNHE